MCPGCQISRLGREGAALERGGEEVRLFPAHTRPPPSSPSQPLIPRGKQGNRWEGPGGRGEVGGGTVCPPPLPPRAGWRGDRPQPGLS